MENFNSLLTKKMQTQKHKPLWNLKRSDLNEMNKSISKQTLLGLVM